MARFVIAAGVLLTFFAIASELAASGTEGVIEALYVFGDSYVDTGNTDPNDPTRDCSAWCWPYGSTWPGHPTGRVSDGRLLTDNIECYLGVESPIPFRNISTPSGDGSKINCASQGINFAVGGSGVFALHNVSMQIEDLKTTIGLGCVPVEKRSKSVVLYAVNGNDYVDFLLEHKKEDLLPIIVDFIQKMIDQMVVDIRNLLSLGFANFIVTNMGPVNLYPVTPSYLSPPLVIASGLVVDDHNNRLHNQITNLQVEFSNSTFFILNLHEAFTTILQGKLLLPGPCLPPPTSQDCSTQPTTTGKPCPNVNQTLFWDGIHPTQAGWSKLANLTLPIFLGCDTSQPAFATI